jgi:c-di-GMP-binding flagellar brake protein YcgR
LFRGGIIITRGIIKVNQRLDIIVASQDQDEYYHSRIEEVDEHFMILAMPIRHSLPVFLPPNTEFYGSILDSSGRFQFKSIYKAKKMLPIPIWVATLPTNIKKVQLRSFVRLDVNVSVSLIESESEQPVPQTFITRDLSGGGLCLISKVPIPPSTPVNLTINLAEQGTINASGITVRLDKQPSDLLVYLISIKFVDIIEHDRSKIMKFIFQKQLERKRKGY